MKLNKREKLIFYLCIILISVMILERLIFSPLLNKLTASRQEIQIKEARLIKSWRIQARKDKIIQEYNKYDYFLKVKGSDEEINSRLLKELDGIARQSRISLSNIKPRSTDNRGLYKEYTLELQLEAEMQDIIRFMYNINNSGFLLSVDKVVLSLKEESSEILKAVMVISSIVIL